MNNEVTFTYKNYRGETSVRLVRPIMLSFGSTGFHPEPQWLLHGWDINKDAERTFAMRDIKDWEPRPQPGGAVAAKLCSCRASERDGQHMAWCPSLSPGGAVAGTERGGIE